VHDSDSFLVTSADGGTTKTVNIDIVGVNDTATIAGADAASFTEDNGGPYTASGQVQVSDVDTGQNVFAAVAPPALNGTYGTFTFDSATGAWGYNLNNAGAAVQALTSADTVTDKLTVSSLDGTASHEITMTIHGADEPVLNHAPSTPVFTPLVQNGNGTAFGTFSAKDQDSGDTVKYYLQDIDNTLKSTINGVTIDQTTGAFRETLKNSALTLLNH
jgi:VCBS repeat-containing protein